jgi:hypothetical protein
LELSSESCFKARVVFGLTCTGISGNAGGSEVEKSAANGTNCRSERALRSIESHHFVDLFVVA